MARPRTISDDQILEAAREAFIEEGLNVATSEIAKRAGVAEGTIFSRFPTKEDLFFAAMGLVNPSFLSGLDDRIGRGTIEDELTELLHETLAFFTRAVPCMMLVVSHGAREKLIGHPSSPPARAVRQLSNYFEAEIKAQRLRPHDPEILARIFIGSAWHYAFCEHVRLNDIFPMPKHIYVRGVIDVLIRGVHEE